ncbi:MAG TPA: hypothetical protein VJV78_41650 [Polyangiales bacterium]|nr:hypothetical protein [Polyangiales bacterium]
MDTAFKYYKRSSYLLALLCLGSGCAGANQVARNAAHLTYAELNGPNKKQALATIAGGPTVIHFKRGEQIPLDLALDSRLIELDAPRLMLVAKRDFDLLLRPDGPMRISGDGADFEGEHGNYYGVGFDVEREAATLLRVKFGVLPEHRP